MQRTNEQPARRDRQLANQDQKSEAGAKWQTSTGCQKLGETFAHSGAEQKSPTTGTDS